VAQIYFPSVLGHNLSAEKFKWSEGGSDAMWHKRTTKILAVMPAHAGEYASANHTLSSQLSLD
jgi:hypothetical protein